MPHDLISRLFNKEYIGFGRIGLQTLGIGHLIFLIIFFLLGVFPLVIVNVFSILIYAYCLKLLKSSLDRNDFTLIGWLVYIELMGHAILACYFIGTQSGFHYYIVLLSALPFLMFKDPKTAKFVKIVLIIIVFSCLDLAMMDYIPPYTIDEPYQAGLRLLNVTVFLSGTIIVSWFYAEITYSVRQQLEYASTTDQLTGLYNRRLFIHLAETEMKNIRREKSLLSIIIMDIDGFKKINDRYGHKCGDQTLAMVAAILGQTVRSKDIVSRWGGEEFIVLLPSTGIEDAAMVAERLRCNIGNHMVDCQGSEFTVTATLGLTANNGYDESLDKLIERADHAMYQGKAKGKNQCVVAE